MPRFILLALVLAACTPAAVQESVAPCQCSETSPAPDVRAGECETDWLPEGTTVDLSDAEAEELRAAVQRWLAGDPSARPRIELARGVVFAKSADDEGRDPPYPSTSGEASTLACGLNARWLREHTRSVFALAASPDMGGVSCDENVCCFSGMEFVSDRAIVFRRASEGETNVWVIASAHEIAEAAIGAEQITANRRYVATELERRARERCDGEPPGFD